MTRGPAFSTWLGLACLAFALLLVFVWIPLDTDSGIVETVRRRLTIGDAMAPTLAGVLIGLGGCLVVLRPGPPAALSADNLRFLVLLLVVCAVALELMRWTGPLLAALFSDVDYRVLRDTAPWKYAGFLTGGTVLIAGLIGFAERRLRWRMLAVAVVACLVLIAVYDMPFDDLLLPPNGDV